MWVKSKSSVVGLDSSSHTYCSVTFNYLSIWFDIIFQNRIYFYSLNEELIFGSLLLLLSFVVVVAGNQSPADVHVVPESTASV